MLCEMGKGQSAVLIGGIEGGGTKFVCAVSDESGTILARQVVPTTTPATTIAGSITFFKNQEALRRERLAALGVGTFGPVDLAPGSEHYGYITRTPKPGWAFTDLLGPLGQAFPNLPLGFDTDVNAAALGEQRWGAAQGLHTFIYLTIGTGIGGGALVEGRLLHGAMHPEMGHIRLPHDWTADPYPGFCPYHGDCFEGLAAGPALELRWGQRAERLPLDHPAWALEARYIALALTSYILTLVPQRIILGGGVMQQPQLFPLVRQETQTLLNRYLHIPAILDHMEEYLVPPALANRAGVLGALALAERA